MASITDSIQRTSDSVTRPDNTTQYASGDLIANSATASAVTAMEFDGGLSLVRRVLLTKDDDDTTSATFRLHFFLTDPFSSNPSNGDNGALALTTSIDDYLGSVDVDMTSSPDIYASAGNAAIGVPLSGTEIFITETSKFYGVLEARGTYTPASEETFTATIELLRL